MNIDIGPNVKNSIEQLATQIGITADKVFPWYMKQCIIEGYVNLFISLIPIIIILILIIIYHKNFDKLEKSTKETIIIDIIFLSVISAVLIGFGFTHNVSKIINPEYHAIHKILQSCKTH